MKNFEFLKDFDSDMYTLLSEFEREAVKNPKITESYVTPFLEKVVNDIYSKETIMQLMIHMLDFLKESINYMN